MKALVVRPEDKVLIVVDEPMSLAALEQMRDAAERLLADPSRRVTVIVGDLA